MNSRGADRLRYGRNSPIALGTVVWLATLVDTALERQPDFGAVFVNKHAFCDEHATELLWLQVRDDDRCPPESWYALQQGVVRSVEDARWALLLLVLFDGWRRIKKCEIDGCELLFADATNGVRRLRCAVHARR